MQQIKYKITVVFPCTRFVRQIYEPFYLCNQSISHFFRTISCWSSFLTDVMRTAVNGFILKDERESHRMNFAGRMFLKVLLFGQQKGGYRFQKKRENISNFFEFNELRI